MIADDILGRIVISKSGRDRGKAFVVVRAVNERYALIADGDLRKIDNPKLKNTRHLQITSWVAEDVRDYLQKGENPADHIIKKSIRRILETGDSEGKEVW